MRRILAGVLWLMLAAFGTAARAADPAPPQVDIELFVREGCAHCEDARRFVAALGRERPGLQVLVRDVRAEAAALERLTSLAAAAGVPQAGVPAMHVRGELVVGFTAGTTEAVVRAALEGRAPGDRLAGASCGPDPVLSCGPAEPPPRRAADTLRIPWLDREVSLAEVGLPVFTVTMGLLDGLNPCSMWVLVLMISLLAGLRDRRKLLVVAGTFVAIEGIAYFAFMAAWLNVFLLVGLSRVSEVVLGAIAIVAGAIHLKDWSGFGRGPSLSIPESAKPGIYARLRDILQSRSLAAALAGTVVLAVLVQLVELMCTSGLPALYTRILTLRGLDRPAYYGYLLLYNAAYMLDDVIVLAIGVITLSRRRLQEAEGRFLKLASGLAMLGLGIYLLLPPGAHA